MAAACLGPVAPSSIIIVWFYQNLVNIYTSNSQFFHGFPLRKNKSTRNNKKKQTSRNFSVSLTSSSNNSYQTKRLPVLSCGHRAKSAERMGRNIKPRDPRQVPRSCAAPRSWFSQEFCQERSLSVCLRRPATTWWSGSIMIYESTRWRLLVWLDPNPGNTQGLCTVFATWLRLKNFKRSVSCIFILRLQFKFIF